MEQQERPVSREDVEVSLAVSRELGPGSGPAVVAEFVDRVGPAIDARVDARLAQREPAPAAPGQPALAFVSVALGVPITAISLAIPQDGATQIVAAVVAWAGLVGVNLAAGRRR